MVNFPDRTLEAINRIDLAASTTIACVSNNILPAKDLSRLLAEVHGALVACASPVGREAAESEIKKPTAARIKKSIMPEALISFIDGKPYKMLKRHLSRHGLDAHSYRTRYGLPADYPITTRGYSEQRSEIARAMRLGQQRGEGLANSGTEDTAGVQCSRRRKDQPRPSATPTRGLVRMPSAGSRRLSARCPRRQSMPRATTG